MPNRLSSDPARGAQSSHCDGLPVSIFSSFRAFGHRHVDFAANDGRCGRSGQLENHQETVRLLVSSRARPTSHAVLRLSNDSSAPSLDAKTTDFISRSTKDLVLDVASGMGDDLYYLSALDTLATRIVVALDTFFPDDGSSFFSLVGRVDGAITGGFTLHVLLGTSYNNIDIATPRGIPRMVRLPLDFVHMNLTPRLGPSEIHLGQGLHPGHR